MMNQDLGTLGRTLHSLLSALPALRQHAGPDVVGRQLALIRHFQTRYDRAAAGVRGTPRRGTGTRSIVT